MTSLNSRDLIPGWLIGRKRICAYCGMSWDTIKMYYKQYDLPLMRLPSGTPAALPAALDRWLIIINTKCSKNERNGTQDERSIQEIGKG